MSDIKNKYLSKLKETLSNIYKMDEIPDDIIEYLNMSDVGYLLGDGDYELSAKKIADLISRMDLNIDLYGRLIDIFSNVSIDIKNKIDLYMKDMLNYEVYVDKSFNIAYNPFLHLKSHPIENDIYFFVDDKNIDVESFGRKYLLTNKGNSRIFRIKFADNVEITRLLFRTFGIKVKDIEISMDADWKEWGSYFIFDNNVPLSSITLVCEFTDGEKGFIVEPKSIKDEYVDIGLLTSRFGSELNFFGGDVLDFYLVGNTFFYKGTRYDSAPFPIWLTIDDHVIFPVFTNLDIDVSSDFTITDRYGNGTIVEGVGNPGTLRYNVGYDEDVKWGFLYSDGKNLRLVEKPPDNYYSFAVPSNTTSLDIMIPLSARNIVDVTAMSTRVASPTLEESDHARSS